LRANAFDKLQRARREAVVEYWNNMMMNDGVDCGTSTQLKSVGFCVVEGLLHSATAGHYVSAPKQGDDRKGERDFIKERAFELSRSISG
jgi:hypothetical protein